MGIKKLIGAAENIAYEKPMLLSLNDCTDIVFIGGTTNEPSGDVEQDPTVSGGGNNDYGNVQDDG